ncbi:hypothetical protein GQX74_011063 [Glossina fuscipes]|nr:hypothetical protein GQX74_011063 [Glossina fuscipes]
MSIYLICLTNNGGLLLLTPESWAYLWKDFNGSITIIVCSSGVSENNIELLAELVFGAFSLFVNRDELSNSALLERLKKESKHYLPIIDAALEFCTNQLLNFSHCLLSNDNAQIIQRLNEFSVRCVDEISVFEYL